MRPSRLSHAAAFIAAVIAMALVSSAAAGSISGRWSAVADVSGAQIPFRIAFAADGAAVQAHFFDGDRPTNPSSRGTFKDGHLHVSFPSYAAVLDATIADGKLEGTYATPGRVTPIHAVRRPAAGFAPAKAPSIQGEWIIPYNSAKGETAWRLIIRQKGPLAEASILRIDGDTGTLNGGFQHGAFRLSHFAGERPALLEITPQPDQTLKLVLVDLGGRRELSAVRAAAAAALGAAPTDPTRHTGVKDPAQPFQFAFNDLTGRKVANTDAKFRHKVVLVDVMGSWCPNCHDEAPFLQALYARHRKDGLEIVALDFEQPDQLADPQRLRAFIQRYGLSYTVLLAGDLKEVTAKIPQAANLNAWPTTFFVGRDGLVKSVHVGFTSPGSGPRDVETRAAMEREMVTLLAQR